MPEEMMLLLIIFLSSSALFCEARVEFFEDENFQDGSLYSAERITTSCETLPHAVQSKVNSIKTDSCIIIYSNEDCQGSFFPVEAGNHPSLPYFKNTVQSYRACTGVSKNEPWRDVRIKLYLHFRSNELLWDTPIIPECVTLSTKYENKASSLKADLCVILFSGPNCSGDRFQVEAAGYDNDLQSFNDELVSFMPCNITDVYKTAFRSAIDETDKIHPEYQATSLIATENNVTVSSRAEFFRYENYGGTPYTAETATSGCINLPTYMWDETRSIKTEECVILYANNNCGGDSYQFETGNHPSMPYFKNQAKSYRACTDLSKHEPWRNMKIKLYADVSSNEVLWDTQIIPDCVTLPQEFRNEASAVEADICVVFFSEPGCIGRQFKIEAAGYHRNLLDFNDDLESFKPCNAVDVFKISISPDTNNSEFHLTSSKAKNSVKSRVELFQDESFQESLYTAEIVTTTCKTLPSRMWNEVSSIKTVGCIILYSHGLCRGSYFVVEAGDHPNLPYFDKQSQSYRACVDVRKTQIIEKFAKDVPRLKLYDQQNYYGLLWDKPISPSCNTIPRQLRNRASSLKSDTCVILFSEPNCNGSRFVVGEFLWDNSLEYFQNKLQSYMPCNISDVFNMWNVTDPWTTERQFTRTPITITTEVKKKLQNPAEMSHINSEQNVTGYQGRGKLVSDSPLDSGNTVVVVFFVFLAIFLLLVVWIGFVYRGKLSFILKRALFGGVANDEKTLWSPGRPLIES